MDRSTRRAKITNPNENFGIEAYQPVLQCRKLMNWSFNPRCPKMLTNSDSKSNAELTSLDRHPKQHPSYAVSTLSDSSWLLPVSVAHSIQSLKAVLVPYHVQSVFEQFLLMSEAADGVAPNLEPKYYNRWWFIASIKGHLNPPSTDQHWIYLI